MAFKVTHVEAPKPERTVKVLEVPQDVRDAMEAEWEFTLKNPGYQVVIGGDTASEALHNLQLAKTWGNTRKGGADKDRVTVTKAPTKPGKESPLAIRANLTKYDPNAAKRGAPVRNGNGSNGNAAS